jgi:uncharacterized protein (DUF849 family)
MAARNKVIITCAPTGAIHTPSMSPHLPVTPAEIAEAGIAAAEAGAAVLHLHARDPQDGRPRQDPVIFKQFLPTIAEATNAVINVTTGGSPHMTVDERLKPALELEPELASLNMGSMNFGLFPMLGRFKEFRHDWEREHLENSRDLVFRNTFADIERILASCQDFGTRFEFECYDIGHLYNLAHFLDRGLVEPPLFVQSVFGILGGIGNHPEDLVHMRRTADRLFGGDYQWSILGAGRRQIELAAMGATMGANVRVGLEDSLWGGPGRLAESNAEQVRMIRTVLEGLSLEPATPDEARAMLGLKGRDRVNF